MSDHPPPSYAPKRTIFPLLDYLLFSNVFIALCAVAQALITYKLIGEKADQYVLGLLFFATMAEYNLSILLSKPKDPKRSRFRRIRWFFGHNRLMISLTIISALSIIALVFFLSMPSKLLVGFLAFISITYNIPIFTIGDKKFSLRNIPGIKLFLIALVWSLSCVLLPILELESHHLVLVTSRDTMLLIAKRFLLVAAITVPFDIRDLFHDKLSELKTIPVMLGEKKAYLFCLFLLVVYMILQFLFNPVFDMIFLGMGVTIALTGWLIFKSDRAKDEYYYFFFLDGVLILQYVMLLVCTL
jgi:4-hydroxybenzoate polyprenyltransferase